jgi:protein SCO1/2
MLDVTRAVVLAAVLAALPGTGCAAAKRYPVAGMVLRVEKGEKLMVVSHGEIKGYMPAMTMPFRVREAGVLDALEPGTKVEFTLVVNKDESWAEKVRLPGGVTIERDASAPPVAAPKLIESTAVALGDKVPDFELTDQQKRTVRLSDFAGKVVAVTFIYTRCPLPDYCPRLSANFQRLQGRFREQIGKDFVLLSITLDPQYDRPEVLAQYGRGFKADPEGWRFLTGSLADVKKVGGLFGVDSWAEDYQIIHNVRTAIIDRQGRLAANLKGNDFTAQQIGDLVGEALRGGTSAAGGER